MEHTYTLYKALHVSEDDVSIDMEAAVFGTSDPLKRTEDTIVSAMLRYANTRNVGNNRLADLTGIDKGDISRYLNGKREIRRDHLCLICIALRLMTCQQRYLFFLANETMPDEKGKPDQREYIIRHFMDGCFYKENFTVPCCNDCLKAAKKAMLSSVTEDCK